MTVSKVSPLAWNAPIVDEKGNPTPYFVRQLERLLQEKAATDTLAEAAVPGTRLINTTSPITGGGPLTSDLTIALDTAVENERIQDMLNSFLVAGANVTLTYDDTANTLTIAASGGSGTFSGAIVKKSADQTGANYSSATDITWDAEEYDTDNYHSTISNTTRLTCPFNGYYKLGGNVQITSGTLSTGQFWRIFINHYNSSGTIQSLIGLPQGTITTAVSTTNSMIVQSMPVSAVAGDYFTMSLHIVSGDTNIGLNSNATWFGIQKVG